MRRLTFVAGLTLLALVALYTWQGERKVSTEVPSTRAAAPLPASATLHEAERAGKDAVLAPAAAQLTVAGAKADSRLASALHSEDPYAQVVKHWNDYRAGGYARAMTLRMACQEALLLARSNVQGALPASEGPSLSLQPAPMVGESALIASQRTAAWHRINQRCLPLLQDTQRMGAPPDDDPYELAKARARESRPERVHEALLRTELAYGHLDQVLQSFHSQRSQAAGQVPWFEGQALGGAGRGDLYDKALSLASVLLYADPQNTSPHLYDLALCAQKGLCSGSLADRLLADYPAGSPERATIQALYPRMMAAVLRGDLDAFEFRKKP